ncbi:putative selenate reductase subunit YgfK [Mycoplasmatota bacterium]|nr:putative selenate reductase subunit YgfK [Mycoplasmatota bacterium]
MSDKMRPISFEKMVIWILKEFSEQETIFGIHKNKFYRYNNEKKIKLFGDTLATIIGPAAGPNSQLAQNIVVSYLTGSRFIELKTVQILDGEDLPVSKPCILASDECYNVEWSTELTVQGAFDEYIKAWFLLHVLMRELKISQERDFMFNMSVGYDLEGIKSPKIDGFIEGMKNASETKIWKECYNFLTSHIELFTHFTIDDLMHVSPIISPSITLSTLHGCPPQEIERIVNYLIKDKHLHTFIKMNPTLLGEKFVRDTLDEMGYDYIKLNAHHFQNDLKYNDGVAMLKRLIALAKDMDLEVGVKLTNTLPVKVLNEELPGDEMYMSGRSLYPLTITLASLLAKDFAGILRISYSGGADYFNIDKIHETGIAPITFATTILKPGGYERITQLVYKLEDIDSYSLINTKKLEQLAKQALNDVHHLKTFRPAENRLLDLKLPLYDCFIAPCTNGCPVNHQIPEYIALVGEKKYDEAFSIIVKDNASPFITGTICDHQCQYKCSRLDYDQSVEIRNMKKMAVLNAQDGFIEKLKPVNLRSSKKVVVIGAGPAGLSCALFLRRNGLDVTVMEKRDKPYGMVEYLIPNFRISQEAIDKDFELVKRQGVKFLFGCNENYNIESLKNTYDYIILATGAWIPRQIDLIEGKEKAISAISFLEKFKADKENIHLGKQVCIIGGGDVAIDAARCAKRVSGVKGVSIVYRRIKALMPASKEEINLALSDGIVIKELLSPVSIKEGKLACYQMVLGEPDASGRRRPEPTEEKVLMDADTVIVAIGESIDGNILKSNGIDLNGLGFPKINENNETNIANVFVAGDMKKGPATVVKSIADGKLVSKVILNKEGLTHDFYKVNISVNEQLLYERKGILCDPINSETESKRCLSCQKICELCVDVCPNRANIVIQVDEVFNKRHQIIHIDGMCNECGNCGVFCPYEGNPYQNKMTVFWDESDFNTSSNCGFIVINQEIGQCKVRKEDGRVVNYTLGQDDVVSKEMEKIIDTCINYYQYIL